MDLGLAGRVAFVTGGTRGIGRATATCFAREGARVAFSYHSDKERAVAVAGEIERAGGEALPVHFDLSDPGSMASAVVDIRDRWGGIDAFVANAVRWPDALPDPRRRFEDIPEQEWQGLLRPNLDGAIAGLQAVLPSMRGRTDARIVMVSSGATRHRDHPGLGVYGAAKAALVGLANGLIAEVGGEILVNIVVPGLTATERNLAVMPQHLREREAARTPSRRLSTPEDIARAIVFLASPANGNITGETVNVTGGA